MSSNISVKNSRKDHRLNEEEGQIDVGPHAMLVQLPLASLKAKEIGFFRMPQEISISWSHVRYSSTATLNGLMFLFGSTAEIHQRDIAVVRNCGFEMYFHNGKQIKFAGLDDSNSLICKLKPLSRLRTRKWLVPEFARF